MRKLHVRPPWSAFGHPSKNKEQKCNIPMRKSHILSQKVNKRMRKLRVRKCNIQHHLRKTSKTLQEITVSGGPKKPVLAREREARLNVQASSQARLNSSIAWACNNAPSNHSPTWHQRYSDQVNGPMRDTSTSCGLRPRLRRCLDHAEQLRKYRWNRWSNHTDIRTRNIKNPCETNDIHVRNPSLKVTKNTPK